MNNIVLRGDIFTTDLGRTIGSEQGGVRYCLVIQNDVGNQFSTTTIVLPLTTKDGGYINHVKTTVKGTQSYIQCEQIRVVDKSRLKNRVERISKEDMKKVEVTLLKQLEIK